MSLLETVKPIYTETYSQIDITSIESSIVLPTYDIEVEDNHNFFGPYTMSNSRSIAGTMVFTMFDREILWELLQGYKMDADYTDDSYTASYKTPLLDQLPPFDITIEFSNEYGHKAFMAIYGVELQDEGAVLSVDDMLVEKTVQYVARDIDILRPNDIEDIGTYDMIDTSSVNSKSYNAFVDKLNERRYMIEGGELDGVYGYDIPYDAVLFSAKNAAIAGLQLNKGAAYKSRYNYNGAQMYWPCIVKSLANNRVKVVPDMNVLTPTSDGKYAIYDEYYHDTQSTDSSSIPQGMLMLIEGIRVENDSVYPRNTTYDTI
jgi:hypothetical protein